MVAGGGDLRGAVDGEVAERVRPATAGTASAARHGEDEREPLHRASLRASGAKRSEKCGFSASARRKVRRAVGVAAGAALGHPAVEELQRVERPEPSARRE